MVGTATASFVVGASAATRQDKGCASVDGHHHQQLRMIIKDCKVSEEPHATVLASDDLDHGTGKDVATAIRINALASASQEVHQRLRHRALSTCLCACGRWRHILYSLRAA